MRGFLGLRGTVALAVAMVAGLALSAPAQATFPGANGKIAYAWCGDIDCGIFTVNPDGSEVTQITHNPFTSPNPGGGTYRHQDGGPSWSPDGQKITFSRAQAADRSDIYVVNADGSGLTQLTSTSDMEGGPIWSPDGTKIAYTAITITPPGNTGPGVFVMDADGTDQHQVTARGYSASEWSPNGDRIAVTVRGGQSSHHYEIHTIRPDGTGETAVTGSAPGAPFNNSGASWSPDASRFAFSRAEIPQPCCSYYPDIFVMNANGSGMTNLTPDTFDRDDFDATWSPDGSKIVFTSYKISGSPEVQIRVMNPDGTGNVQIGTGYVGDWQPIPENAPPDCSGVTAIPSILRADDEFRTVRLSGATDPDGDTVTITIDGVTQDEAVGRRPDARRTGRPNYVRLRAERAKRGDGRVYRIAYTAADGNGGECSGEETVEVRRSRNRPAVDSAPPSYNSFGS